mgnify:CR=1 FL=1
MSESPSPEYSVIIPSYNRADEIDELLDSLDRLDEDSPDFECLIVDDGSTDNTDEVADRHKSSVDFSIRLIRQENQGPGAARNNGMAHANGEVFIFLDSDTIIDPGWLNAIDREVRDGADAFGGPDEAAEDFTPLQKAINYTMTSLLTTGGIRGKEKRVGKYYPRSFNMGLRRGIYEKIGGFGALRHGQDIEFSQRILDTGADVRFIPDAVVYHKRRTSLRKFFKQVFNWGVARINLYKINNQMLEKVHTFPAIATVLGMFLLVLAVLGSKPAVWVLLAGIGLVILQGVHAGVASRSIAVGGLVVLTAPIQIVGYGLGFLWGIFRGIVRGEETVEGFVKNYYK